MKKYISLFILILMIALSLEQARATCPQGWTEKNISGTYNDCDYTVYYCYRVDPQGILQITIDHIDFGDECLLGIIVNPDFWNQVSTEIAWDVMLWGTFPPCPLQVTNMIIKHAVCWRFHYLGDFGPYHLENCPNTSQCVLRFVVCYDQHDGVNVWDLVDTDFIEDGSCEEGIPELPPRGSQPYISDCFYVACPWF